MDLNDRYVDLIDEGFVLTHENYPANTPVPADYRLNQLRLNAQRIDFWAQALSDRYVVVNIPAASIGDSSVPLNG